jgi:hypothetical protein
MAMQVIQIGQAHIAEGSDRAPNFMLASSVTVLAETVAAAVNSSDIHYYVAAVEGATYPALAAVWENEEDAIFDNL